MVDLLQLEDDPNLLNKMWLAQSEAGPLYKPGNYWEFYSKLFLPELQIKGLKNFRRRKYSVLCSFTATDLDLYHINPGTYPDFLKKLARTRFLWRAVPSIAKFLAFMCYPARQIYKKQFNSETIIDYFYPIIEEKFNSLNINLSKFSMSSIGNPEEVVTLKDGKWSRNHLTAANIFIDALMKSSFPENGVMCELGPGIGRNVEFFAQALS